jgi:hypothetical protein
MGIREVFENQLEWDRRVFDQLQQRGDLHTRARPIDHSFIADERAGLDDLARLLEDMSFQLSGVLEEIGEDGRRYYRLEAQTISTTDWHSIVKVSLLMCAFAAIYRVSYDGWGTSVQRDA